MPPAAIPAPNAELFAPGVISDAREQWRITFTADGGTAWFAASDAFFPISRQATIYVTQRRGDEWSTPEVAPFSGTWSDIDPFVAPDGRRLYFSSIRPVDGVTRGDADIYMVERAGDGWTDPIRLGPEVNSEQDELYPSASGDGTLYFASGPRAPAPGRHYDIYRSPRRGPGFAPREPLGDGVNRQPQVNDAGLQDAWDFNPEISADGRMLVFTSLRPGGSGLGDLYVSHLRRGAWTPALNLGPAVNTAADEYHPTLSHDGQWLYFVRRQPAPGDFHRVPTSAIPAFALPDDPPPAGPLAALIAAGQAQQAGDFATMRSLLLAAQELSPDNSAVLYFLAREETRAGNLEQALQLLERLAVQGTTRDIAADSGFNGLRGDGFGERFDNVASRLRDAAAPLVRSDTAFVMQDPDFIPEGMAYDPVDDVFYVGSLHRRSVARVARDGTERPFIAPGAEGLGQVLGMHVDASRRRLWLASLVLDSAAPRHSNGARGWAFLHAYELPHGRPVARYAAPDSSMPHLLNDLVITRSGDVYVTDTEAHAVYRLAAGTERLEQVHGGTEAFRYPNGIALSPDERRLYVAHFEGISGGDLGRDGAGGLVMLPRPRGVTGGGIDGLYACADRLIAVQGLSGFQQVTAFSLSRDRRAITRADAIERRHPIHDWATTGAIVGREFFYIANAQLRRLTPAGALSPPQIPGRSTVLRLREACAG